MTEPTTQVENITTWHLDQALKLNSESCLSPLEDRAKLRGSAFLEFLRLHGALLDGSPLPNQWPQAREMAELHEEVRQLRLKNCAYLSALNEIASWREKCHEYDADVGHKPRAFFNEEAWDMIESCARKALE